MKIDNYVTYLQTLLNDDSLSKSELLEKFRFCFCCDEELVTASEQLHSILEWDSPEKAHAKLYEHVIN